MENGIARGADIAVIGAAGKTGEAVVVDPAYGIKDLLAAVPAGLVELRWAVVCPSCQAPSGTFPTLEAFAPPGHCDLCDLT